MTCPMNFQDYVSLSFSHSFQDYVSLSLSHCRKVMDQDCSVMDVSVIQQDPDYVRGIPQDYLTLSFCSALFALP